MAKSGRGGYGSVSRNGSCVFRGRLVPGKHRIGIWAVPTTPTGSLSVGPVIFLGVLMGIFPSHLPASIQADS